MMTSNTESKREQMQIVSMDSLVPQDHMLRLIDKAIAWSFIYDLVEDKYSSDMGRPSMDPVTLIANRMRISHREKRWQEKETSLR